jgi:hypothetical protein
MNKRKLSAKRTGTSSVKKYVSAISGQHVTPDGGGDWQVKRGGSERASKVFSTQQEAIAYAREVAMNQQTELFVHGRNGQIREKNTYKGDPFPPRG